MINQSLRKKLNSVNALTWNPRKFRLNTIIPNGNIALDNIDYKYATPSAWTESKHGFPVPDAGYVANKLQAVSCIPAPTSALISFLLLLLLLRASLHSTEAPEEVFQLSANQGR